MTTTFGHSAPSVQPDEALRRMSNTLVQAVLARFAADYRRHLDRGKPTFDPEAWYRVEPGPSWTTLVSILVSVARPVTGLHDYVAQLVSDFATRADGQLAFQVALRLSEDVDTEHLRSTGWERIDVRAEWPEADFVLVDMTTEQPELLVNG